MSNSNKPNLLQYPCAQLTGVGAKVAEALSGLGIESVADVLFHLPLRYEDRTHLCAIEKVSPGQTVACLVTLDQTEVVKYRKPQLVCYTHDDTGHLLLRFIHFSHYQKQQLTPNKRLWCYGEVRLGRHGFEMIHPEYRVLQADERPVLPETLTPIYPTTKGLAQRSWVSLTEQALSLLQDHATLSELLPQKLLQQYHLPSLQQCLQYLHRPPVDASLEQLANCQHITQKRLILEELLAHRLALHKWRHAVKATVAPVFCQKNRLDPRCHEDGGLSRRCVGLLQAFYEQLPFTLTVAQQRVCAEIQADLQQSSPMLRLVQGDVGSGKTVVAAVALLCAVECGYQAALMAPTELLAEQHYRVLTQWLAPLKISVCFLSGGLKTAVYKQAIQAIAEGSAMIVVGTHALFQKAVSFSKLGLVVVDEQHRFGVAQRLALKEKGCDQQVPHQLIMTATPIPRTLTMSAYADLDCSVIDELPPGRKPIQTIALPNSKREQVIDRIEHACKAGQQVYWVCPLIETSELLQCQAAETSVEVLQSALPSVSIALVHGRMKPQEKEAVMQQFKAGDIDILVATTVIEVGVDVPNATLMVIENAERLGLSQLHQLRGRVGRGSEHSFCVLLYQAPLSQTATRRIAIMRQSQDGFEIAEEDLRLRGPGEILGTKQTGIANMKIAHIVRDRHWLKEVAVIATELQKTAPEAVDPLIERWLKQKTNFAGV